MVILTLIFSGCSSSNNDTEENPTEKPEENTPESEHLQQNNSPMNFGEAFQPPHFQVEGFTVTNSYEGQLSIQIDYVFDDELFNFIKDNQLEYYYRIVYPTQLKEDINLESSGDIHGESLTESSSQMNGSIEVSEDIPEDYDSQSLTDEPIDFQLIILNKDKDPVHIIDDIYHYLGYDPDLSQTINK